MITNDVVYEEYRKGMEERQNQQIEMASLSTKAQLDQLAENKKLVEAEKQNAFRGAYVDYAKNINPYGVQSELAYGAGLGGAGKGETAQANYYNTYQNRLGEINTNVTNQLRDIANQETSVRLAGDQAKLDIATTYGQQLADAKYARDQQLESYAREDKNNAYTRIMNAISAGYNPTDEELAAAGMTRGEADAYVNNYKRSLYSGSGVTGSVKYDTMSADFFNELSALKESAQSSGDWSAYLTMVDNLAATYNYDPKTLEEWYAKAPSSARVKLMSETERKQYYKGIAEMEGADSAVAEINEMYKAGHIDRKQCVGLISHVRGRS